MLGKGTQLIFTRRTLWSPPPLVRYTLLERHWRLMLQNMKKILLSSFGLHKTTQIQHVTYSMPHAPAIHFQLSYCTVNSPEERMLTNELAV